jgi:hypothetical protein
MCGKCIENVARVARYRWLRRAVLDRQTSEAIDVLIGELDAEISALHHRAAQPAFNPRKELEHFMQCPVCSRFLMCGSWTGMEHVHGGKIEFIETSRPPTRRN